MAMGSSLHPLAASEELDLGRVPLLGSAAPGRDRRRPARDHGAGRRGADRERHPRRVLGGGRGPRAPAPVVRQRCRHARGAARQLVRRRRSGADARRVPDRVEQDPCSPARRGLAGRARARPKSRPRSARASSAAAPTTGAACAPPGARSSASGCGLIASERLSLRVRMLGGTHTGYARLTRRWWTPVAAELAVEGLTERPLYFVSSNSHSLVNIVTGIAHELEPELIGVRRATRRGRHPPAGAERVSRGAERGLVGELPVLRRAAVLQRPRTRGRRRAPRPRAAARRHPPAKPDRAARPRPGDLAGRARPRVARSAARPGRPRRARRERRGDRQHRLPARRRRVQHPPRGRGRPRRHCAACTSSARPPRSTRTSAT